MMGRHRGPESDREIDAAVADSFDGELVGPGDEKEGQQDMFPTDAIDDAATALLASTIGQQYEYKAVVVVKSTRDNSQPITIPIGRGKVLGKFVHELLTLHLASDDFTNRMAASVGKASGELSAKLEERTEEKSEDKVQ